MKVTFRWVSYSFKAISSVIIMLILFTMVPLSIEDIASSMQSSKQQRVETPSTPAPSTPIFTPEVEAHVAFPTNITIPKIAVNANVLALGLTSDGKMAVPDDFKNVGWYKFGARPGEMGSAVMGAHVDNGAAIAGVFKKLKSTKAGDDIYITDSDGNVTHFKVLGQRIYNYKTQLTQNVFGLEDRARLNLITCYGKWLPKEKTYNQRLVVFAELVS